MPRYAFPVLLIGLLFTNAVLAVSGVMLRDDLLRAAPSARANPLGTIKKNSRVTLLAKQGGWTQVRYGSAQGWVRLLFVRRGTVGGTDLRSSFESARETVGTRPDPGRITATAGLRGLDETELKGARFDEAELQRLEAREVGADQARHFAAEAGLTARSLAYLPEPVREQGQTEGGFDLLGRD